MSKPGFFFCQTWVTNYEGLPMPSHVCTPSMSKLGSDGWKILSDNNGDFICATCGEKIKPMKWVKL